jgi:hypothetical protein
VIAVYMERNTMHQLMATVACGGAANPQAGVVAAVVASLTNLDQKCHNNAQRQVLRLQATLYCSKRLTGPCKAELSAELKVLSDFCLTGNSESYHRPQ